MATLDQLLSHSTYYHATWRNADGSPVRCRANGKVKTWKTRPGEFRLPVKHGMRQCFYLTHDNADEWYVSEDEDLLLQSQGKQ